MAVAMPGFTASTKPVDGVREALAWAVAEVQHRIDPALIDETRWLRSKKELSARRGTATVTWYFRGSKWNGTGHGIWVTASTAIRERRLGEWRRDHPAQADASNDFLDHVQLTRTSDTVVWEPPGAAGNPYAGRTLAELPEFLLENSAAIFDAYSEPLTAARAVPVGQLTATNVAAFSEWAFARESPSEAEEVLRVALERRPVLQEYVIPIAARLGIDAAALRLDEPGSPAR